MGSHIFPTTSNPGHLKSIESILNKIMFNLYLTSINTEF